MTLFRTLLLSALLSAVLSAMSACSGVDEARQRARNSLDAVRAGFRAACEPVPAGAEQECAHAADVIRALEKRLNAPDAG